VGPYSALITPKPGHSSTLFSTQLVTEWLGVPFESIVYVAHDTARASAVAAPIPEGR